MVAEANYVSGDDYVVEFLGYRFGFNAADFEERVTAAAVRLGLVADNELDEDEAADLVELVERDWIDEPRSGLDEAADFGYRDPRGGRALLELAPVPSWHEVQFRG
jgi:hypothetical protein